MRRFVFVALLLSLCAGPARAGDEEGEQYFKKAKHLFEAGKLEEAIDVYELVLREWGEDGEFAVRSFMGMVECLARLDRHDEARRLLGKALDIYEAHPRIVRDLNELAERLRGRHEEEGRPREEMEARLEELEQRLKRDGLRGDDLREVYEREKRRIMALEDRHHRAGQARDDAEEARRRMERKLEEMTRLWKENGVPPEEIEERIDGIRERQEAEAEAREEIEELIRRLEEEGVPPEKIRRRVEEAEREIRGVLEREWREDREEDLDEIRREFLHLAEELGIPAEAAERFLAEHGRRRPGRFRPDDEPGRFRPDDEPGRFHPDDEPRRFRPDDEPRPRPEMPEFMEKIGHALDRLAGRLEEIERRLQRLEKDR